jgi:hypothetical protein
MAVFSDDGVPPAPTRTMGAQVVAEITLRCDMPLNDLLGLVEAISKNAPTEIPKGHALISLSKSGEKVSTDPDATQPLLLKVFAP